MVAPYIPPPRKIATTFSSCHPHLRCTFYRSHLAYFLFFAAIGSLSLWLSPKPDSFSPISFVDALFNAVSALTVTGLSSVEMHRFSVSDQVTLLLLMVLGSQVFTSVLPLFLRRLISRSSNGTSNIVTSAINHSEKLGSGKESKLKEQFSLKRVLSMPELKTKSYFDVVQWDQREGRALAEEGRRRGTKAEHVIKIAGLHSTFLTDVSDSPKSQDWKSVGDEAAATGIDKETRIVEQEALRALSGVVVTYFFVAHLMGFIICQLYFFASPEASRVLTERHTKPGFFSLFSTVSSFANAGFILLDENLVPFQRSAVLLICLAVLTLMGNTMYAPTLRVVIWLLYQSTSGRKKLVYGYLLQNPRRCYTHLFPRSETIWLVVTVAAFNAAQIACICGLDWNSTALQGLGAAYKVVDGFFQSITTRNAGMNVLNVADLSAPTLFLFAGMMYVAAYPVYVTRQRSKETIYTKDGSSGNPANDIYVQSRILLARDSVYLFVAIFFICVSERHAVRRDPLNFSIFNLLFDVISAYGNVGLSMGYSCSLRPRADSAEAAWNSCIDVHYSLSGKWSVPGKLVLVMVMMLGRHRGLPDDLDWAIAPPPTLLANAAASDQIRACLPLASPVLGGKVNS